MIFRTHYLIDRDFQLKYAFLLSVIAIITSLLIGGLVYFSLKESYTVLLQAGMGNHPEVEALVIHWRNFLTKYLVMGLALLVIFLTLLGILITHKMVGPIWVLKRNLEKVTQGSYGSLMNLRKGDEFQDVKDEYNKMILSLQRETRQDITILKSFLTKVSDPKLSKEIHHLIQEKESHL